MRRLVPHRLSHIGVPPARLRLFRGIGRMPLSWHIQLSMLSVVLVALASAGAYHLHNRREALISRMQNNLLLMARTAAISIDGDAHERIRSDTFRDDPAFEEIRSHLRAVKKANGWAEEIYTFRPVSPREVEFVVMTNETPYVGHRYGLRPEMRAVFERGESNFTSIYRDRHDVWISAYAPIVDSNGQVVALLDIDYKAGEYFQILRRETLELLLISAVALVLCVFIARLAARGVSRPIEALTEASEKIANGDYDGVLHNEISVTETSRLTTAFDKMRVTLRERIKDLEGARAELLRSERLSAVGRTANSIIHDFKNPIQVIRTACFMLESRQQRERQGQLIEMIRSSVERMNRMTRDVLDFSRDRLILEPEEVDLGVFVAGEAERYRIGLAKENIDLQVSHQGTARARIDPDRMARALGNLVSNATEALCGNGMIRIETGVRQDGAFIRVRDNGPGISEEIQKTLFEPFVTNGKTFGSGLGAAIAKQIVEAHGGEIRLASKPGEGAVFEISLPLLREAQAAHR